MVFCHTCGYEWDTLEREFDYCCQCGTEVEVPPEEVPPKEGAEKGETECQITVSSLNIWRPPVRRCGESHDGFGIGGTQSE